MSMMAAGEFGFAEVAPTCSGQLYTVAAGDTLSAIARRNNVTVTAILAANPQITNPNVLTVGQRICIPGAVTPPGPGPCTGTQYTIAAGDTLFALASRYGVTVDAILAANPGLDPNSLQVGRIICIPTTAPPPTTCPGFTYTIKAGDTLYALARQYGTTIAEIRRYNPGVDPASLVVGQRICIPVPAPPGPGPCQGTQYTIVAGDTLFALAQRYGTTVAEIQRANPGITPESLRVGQIICIPTRR
jgi:LysM repeat protein